MRFKKRFGKKRKSFGRKTKSHRSYYVSRGGIRL